MGQPYDEISDQLAAWIRSQHMFFVATAPLASDGVINCSPKGLDSFRILGPREVAYVDLTGSGIETIAHCRENGRIVLMFCAFDGAPKIVRLHGTCEVLMIGTLAFEQLVALFPEYPGARAILRVQLSRVSESCGYAVPKYNYVAQRDTLVGWAAKKGPDGLERYRQEKNARSLDRLPGLIPIETPPR